MLGAPHDEFSQIDPDLIGRLIAYGGGGAGLLFTEISQAINGASIADWASWMFGVAILGRLIFDVVKFVIECRKKQ